MLQIAMLRAVTLVLVSACLGASTLLPSDPRGRRMFVDLCSSGLGPVQCATLFPVQASNARAPTGPLRGTPRRSLCPDLCANALGFPLCRCPAPSSAAAHASAVDWSSVCGTFCRREGLTVYGCPPCTVKPEYRVQSAKGDGDVNWDLWCHEQCLDGDGGLACNCDLIP